jgi:squalene-associated FAD-dependent desaturase
MSAGSESPGRSQTVVIGGGLAGISAALELASAGASVTLLESKHKLGGATWSVERDGLVFDNGQHVYLRCCSAYASFLKRLGAEDMVAPPRRLDVPVFLPGGPDSHTTKAGLLPRGRARLKRSPRPLPAPLHLASSLLGFPGLSWLDKAMLARAVLALRALPVGQVGASRGLDQVTFGDWLRGHGQSDAVVAGLFDLVVRSTCNLSVEEVSATLGAMVVKTGLLEDPTAADIGWSRVPLSRLHGEVPASVLEGLGVRILLRSPVRSLEPSSASATGRWRIRTTRGSLEAGSVVLAVPHESASSLLEGIIPEARSWQRLGRSPIVNVHLVYPRRVLNEALIVSLDPYLQWIFDRTEVCGLDSSGSEGPQYLSVSLSAARDQAAMSQKQLLREVTSRLEEILPEARGQDLLHAFVVTEKAATFAGVPGTASLRPLPGTLLPGLALAGAWCNTGWPATMESAVRSGLAAARSILAAGREERGLGETGREERGREEAGLEETSPWAGSVDPTEAVA